MYSWLCMHRQQTCLNLSWLVFPIEPTPQAFQTTWHCEAAKPLWQDVGGQYSGLSAGGLKVGCVQIHSGIMISYSGLPVIGSHLIWAKHIEQIHFLWGVSRVWQRRRDWKLIPNGSGDSKRGKQPTKPAGALGKLSKIFTRFVDLWPTTPVGFNARSKTAPANVRRCGLQSIGLFATSHPPTREKQPRSLWTLGKKHSWIQVRLEGLNFTVTFFWYFLLKHHENITAPVAGLAPFRSSPFSLASVCGSSGPPGVGVEAQHQQFVGPERWLTKKTVGVA